MKNFFKAFAMSCLVFFTIHVQGQFILNGTAFQLDEDCYQLTPAAISSIASIYHEDQISLANSFDLSFNMNFGCTDIGADGMVFVLNPSSTTLGDAGGDIGYGFNFNPSLGVEFDTYNNIVNADPAADHITVIRNGIVDHNNSNSLTNPVNASPTSDNIEDCAYHPVRIIWNADNMLLEVYFDCVLRTSYSGDIVNEIFGGDPMVYWGFTASTGGKTNIQSICFNPTDGMVSGTNQTISICEGENVQLSGSSQNIDYTWTPTVGLNSPSSNPIATPTENITYIGLGLDACENEFSDTFNIVVNMTEIVYEIQPAFSDTTLCNGEIIDLTLQTNSNNEITWQDGSSAESFTISESGQYEVLISNDCSMTTVILNVESANCLVSMPNVFTPDSDGMNDFFAPVSEGFVEIVQFKIFNRWGEVVYSETTPEGWDGTHNDKAAPRDVYVYSIEFVKLDGTRETLSGDVTLIR